MKTIHYYQSGNTKFYVIGIDGKHYGAEKIPCSGKREAKKIAKEINATPWNF